MGDNGSPAFFVFRPLLSTIRPRLLAILWSRDGLICPPVLFALGRPGARRISQQKARPHPAGPGGGPKDHRGDDRLGKHRQA